ncbi:response regulator [bacterium]|nr:response regulator [bacterium]MBU1072244.1 response regulator [bacterium]MBU1674384.1 response regulator [bacterium]
MSEADPRNIKILLVDDEEDLVTLLAERLSKRRMDVVWATSGEEALAISADRTFDVAVIDLKMPHMDGVEVMQRLKASQPLIETIMFTGHGTMESALEAGKLDAFRYMMKPCDFDELVGVIQAAYEQRRTNLRLKYEEELQQVVEHHFTPRDILHASEELRRKYEQD